jgi:hypothetical protein
MVPPILFESLSVIDASVAKDCSWLGDGSCAADLGTGLRRRPAAKAGFWSRF